MIAARPPARRIVVGLALAAALATSACAAGQLAETAQEKATLDGTNVNVGKIALRGLAVQTPDAVNYAVGSDPQVMVVFVNDGNTPDRLVSISSPAATSWGAFANSADIATSASSATGTAAPSGAQASIKLPAGVATSFGVPAADNRVLALTGTKKVLFPGNQISITFTFAKAGSETFQVPIQISDSGTGTYHPKPEYVPTLGASAGSG